MILALSVLAWCAGGCPTLPNDNVGSDFPNLDQDGNFNFDRATSLNINSTTNRLTFSGEISGAGDTDVFSLGTLSAGDRLEIDIDTVEGNLDPVAAVFDPNREIHLFNDDRVSTNGSEDLDPLIDDVIRGESGVYFLGIAAFSGSGSSGKYHVTIRVTRGVGVPDVSGQIVYLNWAGGSNIVVRNVGTFNLKPFDAADLGAAYAGRTAEMKRAIQNIVRNRYSGFDLTVISSDDGPEPATAHSTVHFGGTNRNAFAISEQIDTLNGDPGDDTIIFSSSFADAFVPSPSFEAMATAVGNTVAHEIGHLLGLVHTADPNELMDTTGVNERLLEAQQFGTAALDSSVFPIGVQDAVALIGFAIGFAGI